MSKQIFSKIAKIGEEVRAVNKVEFVADPTTILNKVKTIDNQLRQAELKMDKAYQEYLTFVKQAEKQLEDFDTDLSLLQAEARKLGIEINVIPSWKEAMDNVNRVAKAVIGLKTLYN
jgi:DNA repair ATPase RecN